MRLNRFARITSLVLAILLLGGQEAIFAKDTPKANPTAKANVPTNNGNQAGSANSNSISANTSANTNGNSSGKKSDTTPPEAQVAKPSSNSKLNTTGIPKEKVNSRAAINSVVRSRTSSDCRAVTAAAKAKLAADPCSDFIVVFEPGFARATSNQLLANNGAQLKHEFNAIFNGALVTGPLSKMQALANNPNVLVVEDDLEVKSTAIESPAPWGLDRIDQRVLPLSNSFNDSDLSGVNTYSYVVDTGIDATNLDFAGRVAPGFTAVADGLGSMDCNGHGTHVAGIIGGSQYGVAKSTTLIPVRVLDCTGSGSYSSVIAGLDWIASNYRAGDAAVVNLSLGGPASSTLDGAIKNLISKGVTVVVAAGNSSADACNYSPSRVAEAITVGATASNDYRASYSNYGTCIDLFAPGSAITSTWLGANGVNTISGTSMASPNVAGVAARFLASNPTLTPAQVANSLAGSATKGVVINPGTGSVNNLVYLDVVPDTTTTTPVSTSPTFKKVTPRGKK